MALRLLLGFLLTAPFAGRLAAAPAPFPNAGQKAPAEVVLAAESARRVKLARTHLNSTTFRDLLLTSPALRKLGCLKGVKDRPAWLAGRLKVDPLPGDLVRVRVEGCSLREAVLILRAVVDQVARKPDHKERLAAHAAKVEAEKRQLVMVLLELRVEGSLTGKERVRYEETMARLEFEAKPLQVKRPPARAPR